MPSPRLLRPLRAASTAALALALAAPPAFADTPPPRSGEPNPAATDAPAAVDAADAPNIPVPPLALVLGPLAMWPAPVKYRIYFGEPLHFEGDPNDDDAVIAKKVAVVKGAIQELLDRGLAERRGVFI